jgi:glyoxylase-like metal-dependent hydrolase (beta-lactamase superfamily II)
MKIKVLEVGPLASNCIILWDEGSKKGIVADPGDEPDRILDVVRSEGIHTDYIICTHGHFDHVGAVPEIKAATGAKVALHGAELELYESAGDQAGLWGFELEALPPPDILLKDGDELKTGVLTVKVIHTPGHSPGGVCLLVNGTLLTGDTLFAGSVGRTDFSGGDMGKLLESLRRIASLPHKTAIIPGHGPLSTIEKEIKTNPFYEDLKLL